MGTSASSSGIIHLPEQNNNHKRRAKNVCYIKLNLFN